MITFHQINQILEVFKRTENQGTKIIVFERDNDGYQNYKCNFDEDKNILYIMDTCKYIEGDVELYVMSNSEWQDFDDGDLPETEITETYLSIDSWLLKHRNND